MSENERIDLARSPSFRIGSLKVEPPLRQVTSQLSETLQPRVMQVLVALARADGGIVSRDDLVNQCWEGRIVGDDAINRVISRLRRLAEEHGNNSFQIETIAKVGYRLIGTVAPLEPALIRRPIDPSAPIKSDRRHSWTAGLAAVVIVLLLAGSAWWFTSRPQPIPPLALSGFQTLGANVPAATADGITEAALAAFSKDGQVSISRSKPGEENTYALGGTVERSGDKLRVSMRIENRATGTLLWSHLGEQPLNVIDDIPTWTASKIGTVARCALAPAQVYGRRLDDKVMAMAFAECDAENDEQWPRALDIARRLTAAQPNFAGGWSARAWIANGLARQRADDRAALLQEAHDALDRALALDPEDSRAWEVKISAVPPDDLVAVEQAYQRALRARPSYCGCTNQDYASFLRGVGRASDVRDMLGRALDVAPISPRPLAGLAQVNATAGNVQAARANIAAFNAIMLDPLIYADVFVSNSLWLKDYAGAVALIRANGGAIAPSIVPEVLAGYAALQSGDRTQRLTASRALGKAAEKCGCSGSFTIRMQAALGDAQGALDSLAATKPGQFASKLSTIGWDPILADVRQLPGFARLTERAGLLRYWRTTHRRPDFCESERPAPVCRLIS